MVYKRFYIFVFMQAALFGLLAWFAVWSQFREHLKFTGIGFALLAIAALVILVVITTNHNKRIIRFLKSYLINEPYPKFRGTFRDTSFVQIEHELNRIAESYNQVKLDKEAQQQLLNIIIEHIDTAIFVTDGNGQVVICNQSCDKYFPGKGYGEISDMEKQYPGLYLTAISLKPGGSETVSVAIKNEVRQFLVKMSSFELQGSVMQLFSLDDVTGEMMKAEDRNWQKLLRILRHEIMNSVSPITSLAGNLIETFEENDLSGSAPPGKIEVMDTFRRGLKAIDKRSKGLLGFVKSYKSLIEIPEPTLNRMKLKPVFDHLSTLYEEDLKQGGIQLIMDCDESLELETNEELLIQVLVNLVRNAHESMLQSSGERSLKLTAGSSGGRLVIKVSDTGPGISDEHLEQIFIPFFTTKEKGAGIGLSLSRQIINRLGGTISVKANPGETIFTIMFHK